MRRWFLVMATTAATVAVVVAAVAWLGGGARTGRVRIDGDADVRVTADRTVTPAALTPGQVFHYRFTVTNGGRSPVRQVAVRSEKAATGRSGAGLAVRSVSDPACAGRDRVDCLFPRLEPGETRTVRVEGRSAAAPRPGDRLVIHTFPGFLAPTADGEVAYEVIGEEAVTTGVFVARPGASR
ncbi:MAG TPA: hypothetical protein VHJ17_19205 [Thermomonospora sp.]|nr:hypothetical protein [Thermomonospora sp.]